MIQQAGICENLKEKTPTATLQQTATPAAISAKVVGKSAESRQSAKAVESRKSDAANMIQQTEIDGNKRDGKLQTATAVREKIQQDAVLTKEKTGTKMLIQKAEPLGNGKGKIGEGSKMQNGSNFPE